MSIQYPALRTLLIKATEIANDASNDSNDIDSRDNDYNFPQLIGDVNKHTDYLWLLIFDLLIFLALTFISYTSVQKLASRNNANTQNASEEFKVKFIKGLLYANGGKFHFYF